MAGSTPRKRSSSLWQKLKLHPVAASVDRRRSSRHFGIGRGAYLAYALLGTFTPDFASTIDPSSEKCDVSSRPKTVVYLGVLIWVSTPKRLMVYFTL
ncbi:hypothetical protein VM1G_11394 [Cytospora mali]|uniref:Uncharacterized protein n=1 Tax=Cytospora mali TaxID=578113 RepID=A0A194VR24_CYTMA|nr:hypothetical protein VM1G_11394 [Valsa mali]